VSNTTQHTLLGKLLLQPGGKLRLTVAISTLVAGTTLLLLSVLVWWNFGVLLSGDAQKGNTTKNYVVIGKLVTDYNMANVAGNTFSPQEVQDMHRAPQVQDVGEVIPARFAVYAVIGGRLAMATDLPLESVPDRFLEEVPEDWTWEPGKRQLPVILSSQFLDVYNYVFAPSQGLPQLSRTSVKAVGLKLQVGGEQGTTLSAHVAGFSEYLGSVLAPPAFIAYGNKTYGQGAASEQPSRLVLKVADPSDTRFAAYLEQHGYTANPQNLRWSKMRAIVEVVTTATGVLALLLMGMSTLVFVLFIQLSITRAQQSLVLLGQLGYSPKHIYRFVAGRYLPLIVGAMAAAMLLCCAIQVVAAQVASHSQLTLPKLPGLPVWGAFGISTLVLLLLVSRSVKRAIRH
jgi:hypothetical protein